MPTNTYQRTFDELDEAKYIGASAGRHTSHAAIEFAKYTYWSFLFYHTHQIRSVAHYHAKNWVSLLAAVNLMPLTLDHLRGPTYRLYRNGGRDHEWSLHLSASLVNSMALMSYRYFSEWGMLGHIAANVLMVAAAMSFGKNGYQPQNTEENVLSSEQVSSISRYKQQHRAYKCNHSVLSLLSTIWPLAIDYCGRRAGHSEKMKIATYALLGSAMFFYTVNMYSGMKLQRRVGRFPQTLEKQDAPGYEGSRVVADQPNSLRFRLLPPFAKSSVIAGLVPQQAIIDADVDDAEKGVRRVSIG
ncbi:MAG: hypothetical protein P1U40_12175 [Coxiellaceae bacterium]|nr:hypothetical protein [Coxiellaceae bacterium]